MNTYLILVFILHTVSAGFHSLRYFYTATSGISDIPKFVDVGIVNDQVISYYDSIINRKVPKQTWMKKNFNQQYWDSSTDTVKDAGQVYQKNMEEAKKIFNHTGGVHILQTMYGCEWDEETGVTQGFHQSAFDGEDFLVFDLEHMTWVAPVPQAVHSKMKWESNPSNSKKEKEYLTETCIEWLKKYVHYGNSSLMRTVPPTVSLLQKNLSSPVTCHATGFYPSRVMVTWQKDGQDHHEDVEMGETLQNDDGTFQKSLHLTVKPEEWKNNKYQCVVQVSGIKEDFIKVLTESEIQTNCGVNEQTSTGIIIGVVVAGLLVIAAAVIGVVISKKNSKKGFIPANTSDDGSKSSNNCDPKA